MLSKLCNNFIKKRNIFKKAKLFRNNTNLFKNSQRFFSDIKID